MNSKKRGAPEMTVVDRLEAQIRKLELAINGERPSRFTMLLSTKELRALVEELKASGLVSKRVALNK